MFEVIHKEKRTTHIVYGICGISFLFFDEELSSWCFDDMSNYEPAR